LEIFPVTENLFTLVESTSSCFLFQNICISSRGKVCIFSLTVFLHMCNLADEVGLRVHDEVTGLGLPCLDHFFWILWDSWPTRKDWWKGKKCVSLKVAFSSHLVAGHSCSDSSSHCPITLIKSPPVSVQCWGRERDWPICVS